MRCFGGCYLRPRTKGGAGFGDRSEGSSGGTGPVAGPCRVPGWPLGTVGGSPRPRRRSGTPQKGFLGTGIDPRAHGPTWIGDADCHFKYSIVPRTFSSRTGS